MNCFNVPENVPERVKMKRKEKRRKKVISNLDSFPWVLVVRFVFTTKKTIVKTGNETFG